MKPRLDMDRIARTLGAKRGGRVRATGGYFGAAELAAEIEKRFRVPGTGGRPTDPRWTAKRLVGLSPETLKGLQKLSIRVRRSLNIQLDPMQAAALLLEKALHDIGDIDEFAKRIETSSRDCKPELTKQISDQGKRPGAKIPPRQNRRKD